MPNLTLPTPTAPTFYFIGVTTGQSSSRRMFPAWMLALGRPEVQWVGIDLPLNASPESYRQVVQHIKQTPLALGALVTTHKLNLLSATRELFDKLGSYARQTNEVSSISKKDGLLIGQATDPIAGGLSLDAILGANYFTQKNKKMLILGAGGAGTALCLHLLKKSNISDCPQQIIVVDISPQRLTHLKELVAQFSTDMQFELIQSDSPQTNDELMNKLPEGSVVINATGMGKDTAGSPITNAGLFPKNGVVWELNYRGKLDFYQQAKAQETARNLTLVDGWDYFIHGWSQVISYVLHIEINPSQFATLSQLAANIR